tara:strand:- start:1317 stop:1697 length:381 start_codon:yes stop_codon:yes gene_type:complete
MRFEIRNRPDGKFVECSCRGTVTSDAMQVAVADMRQIEGYAGGLGALWDFRQADLSSFSVDDMKSLLDFMDQTPKRRSARVALIVARKPDVMLLELWRAISSDRYGQSTKIFEDYEAACLWLLSPD